MLVSTRIRSLLLDSGAFSVEIGKPSVEDSTQILMAAVGLPQTARVPAEAKEIVELCGRLPLALVMAGKLIRELEMGSEWDGVSSILREELRGDEQASSREQGVIRASLAGLKGSERDRTGAQKLFKCLGLVPEDTVCPLECLQLIYDALYETSKPTSVLHIRKWLRKSDDFLVHSSANICVYSPLFTDETASASGMLINRSLVCRGNRQLPIINVF